MSLSVALAVWLAQSDVAVPNARQLEFMDLEFTQFMRELELTSVWVWVLDDSKSKRDPCYVAC